MEARQTFSLQTLRNSNSNNLPHKPNCPLRRPKTPNPRNPPPRILTSDSSKQAWLTEWIRRQRIRYQRRCNKVWAGIHPARLCWQDWTGWCWRDAFFREGEWCYCCGDGVVADWIVEGIWLCIGVVGFASSGFDMAGDRGGEYGEMGSCIVLGIHWFRLLMSRIDYWRRLYWKIIRSARILFLGRKSWMLRRAGCWRLTVLEFWICLT